MTAYRPHHYRLPVVDRLATIAALCQDRLVLDVGCQAAETLPQRTERGIDLHARICSTARCVIGFDLVDDGRDLRPQDSATYRFCRGDVCELSDVARAVQGDAVEVVVMGEILEHLTSPGLALATIRTAVPDALLVITVPNALRIGNVAGAARGCETVHEDHVAWYSPTTITTLLRRTGWDVHSLAACHPDSGRHDGPPLQAPMIMATATRHQ